MASQLVDLRFKPDIRRQRVLRSASDELFHFTGFNDKGAIGFDWVTVGLGGVPWLISWPRKKLIEFNCQQAVCFGCVNAAPADGSLPEEPEGRSKIGLVPGQPSATPGTRNRGGLAVVRVLSVEPSTVRSINGIRT